DEGTGQEEEEGQPRGRQAQQRGRGQGGRAGAARRRQRDVFGGVRGQRAAYREAFTCSHSLMYRSRRGVSLSRCAFGSVTAFGFPSLSAFRRSLEEGRAFVFADP